MEIYQLKVFLAVARCLNFTEAAARLNLTQPAVSAKIKSLESELKTSLFDRLGRQIQLTDVGQYLVQEAEKLVNLEAEVSYKIEKFKQQNFNKLTIGSSSGLAHSWLPKIIYQYRHKYPEIEIKLHIFDNSQLLAKAIVNNNIDLGFSESIFSNNPDLDTRKIGSIQYGLIVASDRDLAKKNWYTLADIKQKPLILLGDRCLDARSPHSRASLAPYGDTVKQSVAEDTSVEGTAEPFRGSHRFSSHQFFVSRLAELNLTLADFPHIETVDTIGLMRAYLTQGDYIGFASNLEFQAELDAKVLTQVNLQEFALPADIYVSSTPKIAKAIANPTTPINKFLALFPANSAPKSPIFLNSGRHARETITINLGVQNGTIPTITTGLILQRLRLLEHFLPKTGRYARVKYDIHWHNYLSGMPIVEGLHNNKLDIGILGDYPLLQSAIPHEDSFSASPTQLVSFVSINPHGDGNAVIVPQASKLKTIEDLKGKTVALPVGSSAHGMLLRSLSHLDLLTQVQLFPLNNSQLKISSHTEIAAGFAYFSPFHQLATEQGNFKYLFAGNLNQLPGFYGVVVSPAFANKYSELIVSYLQAIIAAQNWLANTPSAISLVSQWTKIKPKILTQILSPNNSENYSSLFINDSQIRSDWLLEHINQLKVVPSLESLQKIKLDRWIQSEFLEFARQN